MECSFCGENIKKGTGIMYVKKDGKILYFCKSKCEKNMLKLNRTPRKVTWTKEYAQAKVAEKRGTSKINRAEKKEIKADKKKETKDTKNVEKIEEKKHTKSETKTGTKDNTVTKDDSKTSNEESKTEKN